MGQPDVYPFILSPAVVRKLGAIHNLIHGEPLGESAAPASQPGGANPAGSPRNQNAQRVDELLGSYSSEVAKLATKRRETT
jgi:hypothetical protein